MKIISKDKQGYGAFNNGEIIENKPIGFPQDGGEGKAISNLFYWANAVALEDSTIGLHPHQGFEILSFVLEGTIRHFDTKLNNWVELNKGDVQIIRAGNGISHAEHMVKGARMFQIWFDPELDKTLRQDASYSDYKASEFKANHKEGYALTQFIGSESHFVLDTPGLQVQLIQLNEEYPMTVQDDQLALAYILDGDLTFNGELAKVDDYIILENGEHLVSGRGQIFEIRCQKSLPYPTYAERMQMQNSLG